MNIYQVASDSSEYRGERNEKASHVSHGQQGACVIQRTLPKEQFVASGVVDRDAQTAREGHRQRDAS